VKSTTIRALLVDDDEDDFLITRDLLAEIRIADYRLEWASSFERALEIIGRGEHDVYLIDYRLGASSGLDLIKQAIADGCRAPMILLTGQGDSEVDIEAMKTGAMDYLVKGSLDSSSLERSIRYSINRKLAEEALRESEDRYRVVSELTSDYAYACRVEHDGSLIGEWITGAFSRITGYGTDELSSFEGWRKLTHPQDDAVATAHLEHVLNGETKVSEYRILTKHGKIRWMRDYGRPVWSGGEKRVTHIYGAVQDITEQKRAEEIQAALFKISEATNQSDNLEELLRTIQEILGTLIDTTNFSVALHDKTEDLYTFPYSVDERDAGNLATRQPKRCLIDYVRRIARPALIDRDTYAELERQNEIEPCANMPLLWLGVPLKTPQGVIGVVAVQSYADPTLYSDSDLYLLAFVSGHIAMAIDRKQAEDQKRKLRDQLNRAERMESLGILAGGVAHDLNNILGPLVAYPEVIKMKLPDDSPILNHILKIESSAKRASEVVQDLLTLARRGRYEMVPVDLNQVIETYIQSPDHANIKAKYPAVTIITNLDQSIPGVLGSTSHLSKAIMNLVINAYEAMTAGGELLIRTECKNIKRLSAGFDNIEMGRYVIATISDTGHGISEKDLKHLFEPFYTKKEMGKSGSGLGLAIVYGVIKDHNGYIDVSSRVNRGTSFAFYLPAVKIRVAGTANGGDLVDIRGVEKILVVDDLEEQRELAATVLSSLGYDVRVAAGGRQAVEYLKSNQVDVVILDMIMEEGFDGLDTYREIIKSRPGQKAIICSGYSQTDRVKEAEKLGVGRYIRKPYTMQILGKAIREVLAKAPQASPKAVHQTQGSS